MEQVDLLRYVVEVLDAQHHEYMVVGSFASALYGQPRFTNDIDIVIELSGEKVSALCEAFSSPDFYVNESAVLEAVRTRRPFNIIHPESGNKVDFMVARTDAWGASQLARRIRKNILPDLQGYVAAPEDVILGKLWYFQEGGSDKHLQDITTMLQISAAEIDCEYVEYWSKRLGLMTHWQAVLDRLRDQ